MTRTLFVLAVAAVVVAPLAGQTTRGARPQADGRSVRLQPDGKYKVPRTAWGDPDLQGLWPSTDMVGVPLQRAADFGGRNLLTDEEFKAREAAFSRQNDEDNAEFSIDKVTPEQEARWKRAVMSSVASCLAIAARCTSSSPRRAGPSSGDSCRSPRR